MLCGKTKQIKTNKQTNLSIQAVLKTCLHLGPEEGFFDPNSCVIFPTILVSLIKETASVHKSCFSGGYHYNICCHKPLGIHSSLSVSLSQKDKKIKGRESLSCCRTVFLCKTAVSGVATSTSGKLTGQCCRVQSREETWSCIPNHVATRAQHCTGTATLVPLLEGSPSAPPARFLHTDMSQTAGETSAPWVCGDFGKTQSLCACRRKSPSDLLQIIHHALRITNLFHLKRGQRGSLLAREHFSLRKIS